MMQAEAELFSGRCQYGAFAGTLKNSESDLILQALYLISERWLADIEMFCSPAEIQCVR